METIKFDYIEYIKEIVCDYYHIPIELMESKTRKREIVQIRQIAMYFSKKLTKQSLYSIGLKIGGKNHATVLHAIKTINNLIDTDKSIKNEIIEIENQLRMNRKYGTKINKINNLIRSAEFKVMNLETRIHNIKQIINLLKNEIITICQK